MKIIDVDSEDNFVALVMVSTILTCAVLYLIAGWIYWSFVYTPAPSGVHVEFWFLPLVIWIGLILLTWGIIYGVWRIYVKRTK